MARQKTIAAEVALRLDRGVLLETLKLVSRAVPSRTPKDILKSVLMTWNSEQVTFTATDTEVSLICTLDLPGAVKRSGAVLLPTDRLIAILKDSQAAEVSLSLLAEHLLVTCGGGEWQLQVDNVADFPVPPASNDPATHVVFQFDLARALQRTAIAVEKGLNLRYALTGVLFECLPSTLVLAATDSRRLAVTDVAVRPGAAKPSEEATRFVLPMKAVSLLVACDFGSEVQICRSGHSISFRCGPVQIQSREIEGRFPNYRDVIPENSPTRIEIMAGPFLSAVRQAAIITSQESRGVRFCFAGGELELTSQVADIGTAQVTIPVAQTGPNVDPIMDPQMVIEFLRTVEPESLVVVELTADEDPILFRCGELSQYVVMPLAKDG